MASSYAAYIKLILWVTPNMFHGDDIDWQVVSKSLREDRILDRFKHAIRSRCTTDWFDIKVQNTIPGYALHFSLRAIFDNLQKVPSAYEFLGYNAFDAIAIHDIPTVDSFRPLSSSLHLSSYEVKLLE